ncbi:MAG: sugar transferase [Gemmatimonadetes bacterium]|nr:sugar transferase [Gemmatimonadota bacterium]
MSGWQYALALLIGLFATGNYGAGDLRRDPSRLLAGCALASALPLWAPLWDRGLGLVAAQYVLTTFVVWLALSVVRLAVETVDARIIGRRPASQRTVLVGSVAECEELSGRSAFAPRSEHALLGYVDVATPPSPAAMGHVADLPTVIQQFHVETVVVCGHVPDDILREVVEQSITAGCHVFTVPRAFEVAGVAPGVAWKRGQPLVELTTQTLRAQQLAIKRIVDVAGAGVGLVLAAPLVALVALLIKLDSRGPVFFKQRRVGMGGRPFMMIKIRTMADGADALKESVAHLNQSGDPRLFKIAEDPRVSRMGGWLRRWSIDELPQLWNVLQGDMSLVGPRPFFESDLDYYEIHHFSRLGAKPGITGLWQVNGRSDIVDFEEVVALDTRYVREWSLLLDARILLKTLPAVIRRKGAA